jgi:hypothetical protein
MSYDLEIGTHRQPTREQVEAWVAEQNLRVGADDGGFVVSRVAKRGDGHLFRLDGPVAAEVDDFAEDLAAACLAPRWMVTVNVPCSSPSSRGHSRQLAEANDGAAFDPQEDKLVWPRGKPKRVEPRRQLRPPRASTSHRPSRRGRRGCSCGWGTSRGPSTG